MHCFSKVVKPYYCLFLLSGSSPLPVSTVVVKLGEQQEELLGKLQKGRMEGECTSGQKIIVVECF